MISEKKFQEFEEKVNTFPRMDAYVQSLGKDDQISIDLNRMFQAYSLDIVYNLKEILKDPDGPDFVRIFIGHVLCEEVPQLLHNMVKSMSIAAKIMVAKADEMAVNATKVMFATQLIMEVFKHDNKHAAILDCMIDKFSQPTPDISKEVH